MSHFDQSVPKYNAKLGVPPARPILQLLKEKDNWRKDKANMKEEDQRDGEGSSKQTTFPTQKNQEDAMTREGEETHTNMPNQEDEEDAMDNTNVAVNRSIRKEEETQLSVGWNKSLSLKRGIETIDSHGDKAQDADTNKEENGESKKRIFLDWTTGRYFGGVKGLHSDNQSPWCIMGDFNELLSQAEKDGLHPQNMKGMDLFNCFVSDLGLMDLHLKGCKYTWVSNPRNGFITREKLDRVLVNWPWRDLYSNAMAIALPPNSSDHSPIIMWTNKKMSIVKNSNTKQCGMRKRNVQRL
ncbi:Endonuclease/exonuclease/phosphatase superfamily [Sesbania bispinosa]|nr:Endonuclease/exonuclease/phosphatase superfamily [Sesbania bispinosa]